MTWRWRGLMKKEWVLMRLQMAVFLLTALLICFFSVTPVLGGRFDFQHIDPDRLYKMLLTIHLFSGPLLLLSSLESERKRPDVWLHSPAPMWKIIGVKVIMALLTATVSMICVSLMIGIAYFLGATESVSLEAAILFAGKAIVIADVNVVFNTVVVLFTWGLFVYLQGLFGKFAGFIVMIPILFMAFVWGVLTGVFLQDYIVTITGFAVIGLFSILFFSGGTWLLEKKVRF